ncbi:MAG TPA: bifunctional oligoribonuclease/PAP phosphatase NrnA [Firmicutes bacterium]|nr:bifunctional oligoribonuclease/PAP phosphatase NrnA [Bacillota bacterium]
MGIHQEIAGTLLKHYRILIATHVLPDGDAIGSMLGLGMGLQKRGRRVTMACPGGVPENLRFLPGSEEILSVDNIEPSEYDIVVVLDSSDLGRIEGIYEKLRSGIPIVNIDHHATNKSYGTYNYVDTSNAATGEQIYKILVSMNVRVDVSIAVCLFTAIATDTGFFRFSNTTPTTLRIAARLVEKGAEPGAISEQIYEARPLESLKMLGRVLDTLRLDKTGKIAWLEVYDDWMTEFSLDEEQTEGFVNYGRMVRGVEVAFLFRESSDGKIRVGMRSKGEFDVGALAEELGGGGHAKAAGCTLDTGSIAQARELVFGKVYKIMGLAGD